MNVIKRHPLPWFILFILFGIFIGMAGADIAFKKDVARLYREGWVDTPDWTDDETVNLGRALWGFVGGMVSFAIGLVGYTIIKRSHSEPALSLNLRSKVSDK